MSSAPYQIQNQWIIGSQEDLHSGLANEGHIYDNEEEVVLTEPHSSYQPSSFLSTAGPTNLRDQAQTPVYKTLMLEGSQFSPGHTETYEESVYKHQENAIDPSDTPLSTWYALQVERSSAWTTKDQPLQDGGLASLSMRNIGTVLGGLSVSLAATTPVASSSRTKPRKRHYCVGCGCLFDRASRARDHAFKDLGQKPYTCEGECGEENCNSAYSSEALFKEHVAERFIQCPQCGMVVSKKNMARHK